MVCTASMARRTPGNRVKAAPEVIGDAEGPRMITNIVAPPVEDVPGSASRARDRDELKGMP